MKKVAVSMFIVALALTLTGCATIPCAAPQTTAQCDVAYYISVADQIDISLQALVTSVPSLPANAVAAINKFHVALPSAEAAANSALTAYMAGTSKDYLTAMNSLIALYLDVNAVITSSGYTDQVVPAKAVAKEKQLEAIRVSKVKS